MVYIRSAPPTVLSRPTRDRLTIRADVSHLTAHTEKDGCADLCILSPDHNTVKLLIEAGSQIVAGSLIQAGGLSQMF